MSRTRTLRVRNAHVHGEGGCGTGGGTHLFPEAVHQQLLRLQRCLQGLHELPRLAVFLLFLLQDRLHLRDGRG